MISVVSIDFSNVLHMYKYAINLLRLVFLRLINCSLSITCWPWSRFTNKYEGDEFMVPYCLGKNAFTVVVYLGLSGKM